MKMFLLLGGLSGHDSVNDKQAVLYDAWNDCVIVPFLLLLFEGGSLNGGGGESRELCDEVLQLTCFKHIRVKTCRWWSLSLS
jgi:hypothetical protein